MEEKEVMQFRCSGFLIAIGLLAAFPAWGQNIQGSPHDNAPAQSVPQPAPPKNGGDITSVTNPDPTKALPKDTIIIKSAWYSSSDTTTPVPESGKVEGNTFSNAYFGITYPLPLDWVQKYTPPPPSEIGSYVLVEMRPRDNQSGTINGHMEIFAQDMFFSPFPAKNALQMINDSSKHLQDVYKLEMKPTEVKIAGQPFSFFAYTAPVADLHWYVLATEIRCHALKIVMTSRDTKLLANLMQDLNKMKLPAEASPTGGSGGGPFPVCIKDYASGDNVIERAEPTFPIRRYNTVPVRIVVDKEGKIKHIHVLSAFPEQEKAIYEALKQWRLRPYEQNGQRVEVETGIVFGKQPTPMVVKTADAAKD